MQWSKTLDSLPILHDGTVPNHMCAASAGARPGPRQVVPSLTPGSQATDEAWKGLGVARPRGGTQKPAVDG